MILPLSILPLRYKFAGPNVVVVVVPVTFLTTGEPAGLPIKLLVVAGWAGVVKPLSS